MLLHALYVLYVYFIFFTKRLMMFMLYAINFRFVFFCILGVNNCLLSLR